MILTYIIYNKERYNSQKEAIANHDDYSLVNINESEKGVANDVFNDCFNIAPYMVMEILNEQ